MWTDRNLASDSAYTIEEIMDYHDEDEMDYPDEDERVGITNQSSFS